MNPDLLRMRRWLHVLVGVGIGAVACTNATEDVASRSPAAESARDEVVSNETSSTSTVANGSPDAASDAATKADTDADADDARADASTDSGKPRVYCWLVPDPRCGTDEVIDAC